MLLNQCWYEKGGIIWWPAILNQTFFFAVFYKDSFFHSPPILYARSAGPKIFLFPIWFILRRLGIKWKAFKCWPNSVWADFSRPSWFSYCSIWSLYMSSSISSQLNLEVQKRFVFCLKSLKYSIRLISNQFQDSSIVI